MIFFLAGCASRPDATTKTDSISIKPVYTLLSEVNQEKVLDGSVSPHYFFDPAPFAHPQDRSVNVVVLTRAQNKFGYDLELKSGQAYRSRYHCEHEDVWKKFDDDLSVPPFSVAYVPRTLDVLGGKQEVFVFGNPKNFGDTIHDLATHRVRVVGAIIRQVCPNYPCQTKQKWLSNMILLAVDPRDGKFSNVQELSQLKSKVDWEESLAWMQNGFGVSLSGLKPEPVYRVTGEIGSAEAMSYFLKKDQVIGFEEQKKMVQGCTALYNNLWDQVKSTRNAIAMLDTKENRQDFLKVEYSDLQQLNLSKEQRNVDFTNRQLDLKKLRTEANFAKKFVEFHRTYGKRYKTCMRYVRAGSHIQDPERFWFFNYIDLFMWMEEIGWTYRCTRRAWIENPYRSNGKRSFEDGLEVNCTTSEIDSSFDMAVTMMSAEANAFRPHVRFIGYDSGAGGTHAKLYSWVFDDGKRLKCTDEDEIQQLAKEQVSIFPSDVRWQNFDVIRKGSRYDIIE